MEPVLTVSRSSAELGGLNTGASLSSNSQVTRGGALWQLLFGQGLIAKHVGFFVWCFSLFLACALTAGDAGSVSTVLSATDISSMTCHL